MDPELRMLNYYHVSCFIREITDIIFSQHFLDYLPRLTLGAS